MDQWVNRIEIKSATSSRVYVVAQRVSTGLWECSCPGWKSRRRCKHLAAMGKATQAPIQPAPSGLGAGGNFTFTDGAYKHYDTRAGYGSWSEWIRQAEEQARGRSRYREYVPPRRESASFYDLKMQAMQLFGFTSLPADVKELVRAMRRLAMKLHPDRGGNAAEFDQMMQAYERLLRYYPKG